MQKSEPQTSSSHSSFWEKYHNHLYGWSSVVGLIAAFAFFFLQPEPGPPAAPKEALEPVPGQVDLIGTHALAERVEILFTELGNVEGVIGLEKKVFGEGLKETCPVEEWVQGARKEAQRDLDLRLADNWNHLLDKLMKNKFGSDWMLQAEGKDAVRLSDWVAKNALFAEKD